MKMTPINPNKPNIKCYCNIQINLIMYWKSDTIELIMINVSWHIIVNLDDYDKTAPVIKEDVHII